MWITSVLYCFYKNENQCLIFFLIYGFQNYLQIFLKTHNVYAENQMWCIFGRPWWRKIIIASVKGVERFRQIHYNLHIGLQVDKYTANTHCDVRVLIVFAGCHESRTNDRRCPPSSFHGTTIAFHYFYTPFALLVRLSPCLSRNTIYFAVYTTTNDRCSRYNYCVRKKRVSEKHGGYRCI